MAKIENIKVGDFDVVVLKSEIPVLVDFWAPWCGPCQMMGPVLEQIDESLGDKIKIIKINVDSAENQALARQYEIRSIPSLKIFKKGEVVKELGGFIAFGSLKKEIEEIL